MHLRAACLRTHNAPALADCYAMVFGHAPVVDGGVDFQFREERLTIFWLKDAKMPATREAALIYAAADVDAVHERLAALGLCDGEGPTDKPWGVRSFLVRDPDGNTVSFSQEIEGR